MRKILKIPTALLMILLLLVSTATAWGAEAASNTAVATPAPDTDGLVTNNIKGWPQGPATYETAACVMENETEAVLYDKHKDEKMYPASITKVMTCLLAIENSSPEDVVTMTDVGMNEAYSGSSNVAPQPGETFTMQDCWYMMMLKSANDISSEVAAKVGGSVTSFVDMMNQRAAELGCTGTHFNNANGLPDENHYTTAYDMAKIMRAALQNDTFRQIISTTTYTVPATNLTQAPRQYENHNKLIIKGSDYYYEYCIGGKTGYTDSAWRTLVCAAEKNGVVLIGVTMHCPNKNDFTDMASLFNYGFDNFSLVDLSNKANHAFGYVMLPNGVSTDNLTTEEATEDDAVITSYKYEGQYVGRVATATDIKTAETVIEEDSSASTDKKAKSTLHTVRIVAIIFVIILIIVMVLQVFLHINRKKRRRRKNRQRRKR